MTTYQCRHHRREEHTFGAMSYLSCGCDGSVHLACHRDPAPAGTQRPADWPIFLTWRVLCAFVDTHPSHGIVGCDEVQDSMYSEFCRLHRERIESA